MSVALLSVLLWHATATSVVPLFSPSVAQGVSISTAHGQNPSTWVPTAAGTAELVNAIRSDNRQLRISHRAAAWHDEAPPRQVPRQNVMDHRVPYPTRHELHLQRSRSENGELPH